MWVTTNQHCTTWCGKDAGCRPFRWSSSACSRDRAFSRGADQGIDGVRFFVDEMKGGSAVIRTMLVQVKSGKVGAKDIRDLVGTMARESAEMGVFLTLEAPTAPMKQEAAAAGLYNSPWDHKPYPRVHILTVADLLADPYRPNPRCLAIPGGTIGQHTLPDAPKHRGKGRQQKRLCGQSG